MARPKPAKYWECGDLPDSITNAIKEFIDDNVRDACQEFVRNIHDIPMLFDGAFHLVDSDYDISVKADLIQTTKDEIERQLDVPRPPTDADKASLLELREIFLHCAQLIAEACK